MQKMCMRFYYILLFPTLPQNTNTAEARSLCCQFQHTVVSLFSPRGRSHLTFTTRMTPCGWLSSTEKNNVSASLVCVVQIPQGPETDSSISIILSLPCSGNVHSLLLLFVLFHSADLHPFSFHLTSLPVSRVL